MYCYSYSSLSLFLLCGWNIRRWKCWTVANYLSGKKEKPWTELLKNCLTSPFLMISCYYVTGTNSMNTGWSVKWLPLLWTNWNDTIHPTYNMHKSTQYLRSYKKKRHCCSEWWIHFRIYCALTVCSNGEYLLSLYKCIFHCYRANQKRRRKNGAVSLVCLKRKKRNRPMHTKRKKRNSRPHPSK